VTFVGTYAFPWFKDRPGALGSVLGGWTLSTYFRWATGTPFTIIDGSAPDVLFLGTGMKPNRLICVDPNYCSGNMASPAQNGTVPVGAFRHAQYGDTLQDFIGRNTYRTDGVRSIDAGLYKTFSIARGTALMIRLDVFNVFNWVQWWVPTGANDISSSGWDKINTTAYIQTASPSSAPAALAPPRTMQLGFRFIY